MLLSELVALPSVHPEGDAGGTEPGEALMAACVAERMRKLGAAVTLPLIARGRPSVIATFEPAQKPKRPSCSPLTWTRWA
jgi:hypothetical protein